MLASAARATGILLGWFADQALGDPRRWHPVAGFGTLALALERRLDRDTRPAGVLYSATLVGGAVALGASAEALGRRRPVVRMLLTAAATWTVLGRSLAREACRRLPTPWTPTTCHAPKAASATW
ncbi:cobalamin biosynthesis protein [Propioniciclava flava]